MLDPDGIYSGESLGRLQSVSLIAIDHTRAKLFIHHFIHEYIHLSMPAFEAATWPTRATRILVHRLALMLYWSDDKNAPSDGDSVVVHLERIKELAELYVEQPENLHPNCVVFFLKACLWYRGSGYLVVAEKLVPCLVRFHQAWLEEALLAARMLDYIATYQMATEVDVGLKVFGQCVSRHRVLDRCQNCVR